MHSLSFAHFNMVHMTNWVSTACPSASQAQGDLDRERPGLILFPMQRLDTEYMMRTSECPLLKRRR
jgi:hypothetical protein